MKHRAWSVRPIATPRVFALRLVRNALLSIALVVFSLGIGTLGYRELVGLGWLDAALNAAMILTGMGPLAPFPTPAAKLFGIFYSLFSGVAFLTFAAVLFGPVAHRFLHRFHLDLYEDGPGAGGEGLPRPWRGDRPDTDRAE